MVCVLTVRLISLQGAVVVVSFTDCGTRGSRWRVQAQLCKPNKQNERNSPTEQTTVPLTERSTQGLTIDDSNRWQRLSSQFPMPNSRRTEDNLMESTLIYLFLTAFDGSEVLENDKKFRNPNLRSQELADINRRLHA
jgi:hypothetical protein